MADFFDQLSDKHIEFIREQHLFFVGTAVADGRVNVSPKGVDSLRVVDSSEADPRLRDHSSSSTRLNW